MAKTDEGPFQYVSELFIKQGFTAICEPDSLATTCSFIVNHAVASTYTIDWGDGTPIEYASGTSPSVIPTGTITITSVNPTQFRVVTNNVKSVSITGGKTLTVGSSMCGNLTKMTSFAADDLSGLTSLTFAWQNCSGLTSFPLVDLSGAGNCNFAWFGCSGLTSFPLIDFSNATSFSSSWRGCNSLTSFPTINMSSSSNNTRAWYQCTGLTSFQMVPRSTTSQNALRTVDRSRSAGSVWGYCSSSTGRTRAKG